ncbi:MAG: hypothetical protein WKF37_25055, partial [Bryobacteraceae bacterium]
RFDRAPLEDRLLRANPAQPPRAKNEKVGPPVVSAPASPRNGAPPASVGAVAAPPDRNRRGGKKHKRTGPQGPQSAFAEELAKAL